MKLLFLVTEDWYFVSHRLHLARAARDAGAKIFVMTHLSEFGSKLEDEQFTVIPWRLSRRSLNPFRELNTLLQVISAYKRIRPDLVCHIALKPITYGGLAARFCGGTPSIHCIAGMGHAFTGSHWRLRWLRQVVIVLLRFALAGKNSRTVLQNDENRSLLIRNGAVALSRTTIIPGTGVDVKRFAFCREPAGLPIVLLASRMLWEKGVGEFVEAARRLRSKGVQARFVLAGEPDPENPSSIPDVQIRDWVNSAVIEYLGHRDDMAALFSQVSVVCLPSYAEGLPRVLVEAASCGRPIVASDVPGCRTVVRHGVNGFLVPVRDPVGLAQAIEILVKDPELRARMGAHGRELAVSEYDERIVITQMLALFKETTGPSWPDSRGPNE